MQNSNNNNNNREALSKIIVVFMVDGSEKYSEMTFKAIESFQKTTPHVKVGLLIPQSFPSDDFLQRFLEKLPDPNRIETRFYQNHFENWNPTQYKLDLVKFTDRYDTIFWLDSDVLVYKDLSDFLLTFHNSPKNFAFTQDHVTSSDEFRRRWPNSDRFLFIPQAAFMGFKARNMQEFFSAWEDTWRDWITPYPFFKYADPYPSFYASSFCIEQYALGMTVDKFLSAAFEKQVYVIPRNEILITDTTRSLSSLFMPSHLQSATDANVVRGGTTITGLPPYLLALPNGTGAGAGSYSILLSSLGLLSSYSGLSSMNINMLSSYGSLSSAGLLSSYPIMSSAFSSYPIFSSLGGLTSYGSLSSLEYGILSSMGLLNLSSYPLSSLSSLGPWVSSFSSYSASREELLSSLAVTGNLSSLQFVGSSSSGLLSPTSSGGHPNLVIVDNFGDSVIHYYSANYGRIGI